jgi:hypothetical protein
MLDKGYLNTYGEEEDHKVVGKVVSTQMSKRKTINTLNKG